MNTPAHLVLNLALLSGGGGRSHLRWIAAGALLPDLPILGFYLWVRLVEQVPERIVWSARYFEPAWQQLFDAFNSIPLALAGLAAAALARRPGPALCFASVTLHCLLDFPVHREDGHRHFWPFSDWRFQSPVSYWDPAHHGAWGALAETGLVFLAAWLLWKRFPARAPHIALAALCACYALAWTGLYALGGLG